MNNDGLNKVRVALINVGKSLPFLVCFIVLISYFECWYALVTSDFLEYENCLVLNKPISWFLGTFFEYRWQFLFVITILTFAIRTCVYNKLATLYLYINLFEKWYFMTIELYIEYVYVIVTLNIIASTYLVYKGVRMALTQHTNT